MSSLFECGKCSAGKVYLTRKIGRILLKWFHNIIRVLQQILLSLFCQRIFLALLRWIICMIPLLLLLLPSLLLLLFFLLCKFKWWVEYFPVATTMQAKLLHTVKKRTKVLTVQMSVMMFGYGDFFFLKLFTSFFLLIFIFCLLFTFHTYAYSIPTNDNREKTYAKNNMKFYVYYYCSYCYNEASYCAIKALAWFCRYLTLYWIHMISRKRVYKNEYKTPVLLTFI